MRFIVLFFMVGGLSFSWSYADIDSGKEAYYMGEYERAISEFKPEAELDNTYAQIKIGFMYENGWGVDKDFIQALEYYESAARAGNPEGLISIAKLYAYGKGVDRNEERAINNLLLAVKSGENHAYYILGEFYNDIYAFGVKSEQALKWYLKAAEYNAAAFSRNGHYTPGMGHWFRLLTPEGVRLTRLSADAGNKYAQFNIGLRYHFGEGVNRDYKIAEDYFLMAAKNGLVEAQKFVAQTHALNNLLPADNIYVNKWFTIAALGGDKEAKRFKEILERQMSLSDINTSQKSAEKWFHKYTK
jgi:uncharacterized protein